MWYDDSTARLDRFSHIALILYKIGGLGCILLKSWTHCADCAYLCFYKIGGLGCILLKSWTHCADCAYLCFYKYWRFRLYFTQILSTHANIIDVISIKQLHPYLTYNEEDINIFQTQKGVKGVQSLSVADFRMSDLRRNHS